MVAHFRFPAGSSFVCKSPAAHGPAKRVKPGFPNPKAGVCHVPQRQLKPYFAGIIVCMKKTLNIDDDLFARAKISCGATTDTETVRLGLESLVRHAANERLRALRGTEPRARDVPRRREKTTPKRRIA